MEGSNSKRRRLALFGALALVAVLLVGADDGAQVAQHDEAAPAATEAVDDSSAAEDTTAASATEEAAGEEPAAEEPAEEPPPDDAPAEGPESAEPAAKEAARAVEPAPAEEPAAEEAAAEEPVAEEPAVEVPVAEEAVASEEAAAEEAVPAEEPVAEEPAAEEPAAEEPAAEEPVAEEAVASEEAAAEEPAGDDGPVADESAAAEPIAAEPAPAEEPVAEPAPEATATEEPVEGPVARAPGDLTVSDHEGQLKSAGGVLGAYTNGNVTQYAEKDDINFRFDLDASTAGSGTMEIEFSGNIAGGSGCMPFFNQTFSLGTHDGSNPAVVTNSGATPTVGTVGTPVADGNDWSQTLNVTFGGAGSATVYYHLTFSNVAGDCGGSSQHSRIGTTTGDFGNAGAQNVPVPAKDVLELPDITVIKLIDRDGNGTFESTASAGEFCFSLDGGACVPTDGAGQVVFSGIPSPGAPADPHNHTITETQLDFSQGTYVFASGSGTNCVFNADAATATIQADFNNPVSATCTFNNEPVKGNIVVEKQTLPGGSPQQFTFTPSYGVPFQLSDGQSNDSGPLVPGNYSVAETVPAGWVLTSATCDDGSAPGNIVLDPGETVTCTFTNTQDGKIVVAKATLPGGDPETFDFSGDLNGTIGDGGMLMDDVAPGQYTVTEDPPPAGWNLTSISCDDGDSTGSVGTATATFNVQPGETVTCTFTNTKDGKIVVEKQTQPDGDPQTFDFSGALVGTIGDGGMLMDDVAPGQYEVTEDNIPAGWTLASVNCDDLNSVGDAANAKATFNVEPGETVKCTFNNTNLPTIVVQKQTLPNGDPATFDFSGAINATLGDGDSDLAVVAVGQHQVTETVPAGWVLTSIVCSDNDSSGNTATGTATFNVSAGEVVTCVFTNTKNGSITVEKQTLPDGDPQQFTFAGDLAGQIPDDGTISLPVQPGQFSTTETVPGGWVLTDITCNDGNSSGNTATGTATFNVEPGEQVTCVFTNTKNGSITVEKQTLPDGSPQQFTFAGDLAGQIPDDGSISLPVQPGVYSTTETVPAGWQLTGIACSDGNSVGDTLTATAMFDVSAGESVTCVFTNTQEGSVTIVKDALPADGTDFSFDGAFGPFALDDDADATLPDSVTFGGLLPGQYDVTETVPAGWELIGLTCDDQSPVDLATATASIGLAAGEDVTCTFTNRQFGRIIVTKQALPAGSPQQFTFTPSYGAPFQLTDAQSNQSPLLSAGTYSVAEQVPAGWVLTSATCDDGSSPAAIDLGPGETVTCTFTNTQDGQIVVVKQTLPDGSPQSFAFTGAVAATLSDGGSASAAVAPGQHSVSETVPAGWVLTSIACDDANSETDLPNSSANFQVEPGETVTCTFTNTQNGQIVVEKQTQPDGAAGSFTFTGGVAAALSDGGTASAAVAPGTYAVTEAAQPDWQLASIACSDGDSTGDVAAATATYVVAPGEIVTCVFTNNNLPSSILVTKSAAPTSVPETGGAVTFTVSVANTSQADSVTITSVVDDKFGDVSSSCQPALPAVLTPQSTVTCTFVRTVSGSAATDHRNVATVTGTDDDGNPLVGSDDAVVDLTPVIDLEVTADFDPSAVVLDFDPAADADELTVLTATVTNKGPSPATGVEAQIRLPAGVTYISHTGEVSASATTTAYNPATGALVIGDLAVGATVTLKITVSVDALGGHVAVNEVMKANEPDVDSTPGNNVLAEDDQDDTLVTATQVLASGEIGDTIFRDDDRDGVQDPGEPGIPGVVVQLSDGTTAVSGQDGRYLFVGLAPGTYTVTVLVGTAPVGLTITTPTSVTVVLADAQRFLDADFGFAAPPPQVLPQTGLDSGALAGLGAALLLLGLWLVRVGRTRRRGPVDGLAAHAQFLLVR